VPEPGVPESFKVLIKELQSLGLDVKVLSEEAEEIEIKDEEDDISETIKELGLDIHGEESSRAIPVVDGVEEIFEEELEPDYEDEDLEEQEGDREQVINPIFDEGQVVEEEEDEEVNS
jgi:DNA-directed RNA polymerase subunit beta